MKNGANYKESAVRDHWGRKSIFGRVKLKNKVASLMTLCRGESLPRFTTSVLCKQRWQEKTATLLLDMADKTETYFYNG